MFHKARKYGSTTVNIAQLYKGKKIKQNISYQSIKPVKERHKQETIIYKKQYYNKQAEGLKMNGSIKKDRHKKQIKEWNRKH